MTEEEAFMAGWEAGHYDGGEHDCRMFKETAARAWAHHLSARKPDTRCAAHSDPSDFRTRCLLQAGHRNVATSTYGRAIKEHQRTGHLTTVIHFNLPSEPK